MRPCADYAAPADPPLPLATCQPDKERTCPNIADIQALLAEAGLDGWLLFDFRGMNPIAASIAAAAGPGHVQPALGLLDPGPGRAAVAGACHRAGALPRLAGAAAHLRALAGAGGAASGHAGRRAAHRHGVLAPLRHPLRQPRRRGHAGDGARAGRGGGKLGRPGAGRGGAADASADRRPPPRRGRAAAHQGRRLRPRRAGPAQRSANHRVQRAAVDRRPPRRGRAGGRPRPHRGGQRPRGRPALHPHRPAPRRHPTRRPAAAGPVGPGDRARRDHGRHHLGGAVQRPCAAALPAHLRRGGRRPATRPWPSSRTRWRPAGRCAAATRTTSAAP